MSIVAVSGGFDPIHIGHIELIRKAAEYGDVVVLLNSDDFLLQKKGYVFMPRKERAAIMLALKGVVEVRYVIDADNTVCKTLTAVKPDYFINGGDRSCKHEIPEAAVCEQLGIEMIFTGQPKIQSSSNLCSQYSLHRSDPNT